MKLRDLTGQRFGVLLVERRTIPERPVHWECQCDCGNSVPFRYDYLTEGRATDCGCLTPRHRLSGTKTYSVWDLMHRRCEDPRHPNFKNYGARGIVVCGRWTDVRKFHEDMGNPPDGMTLDRIDNNGPYEPGNCRWAPRHDQNRNMRSNRFIGYNNETLCLTDWAARIGLSSGGLHNRLARGWSLDVALTTPSLRK